MNELFRRGHYDKLLTETCDQLLVQQGAPSSFDEIQVRIDFICAIDAKIESSHLVNRSEWDRKLLGEALGSP